MTLSIAASVDALTAGVESAAVFDRSVGELMLRPLDGPVPGKFLCCQLSIPLDIDKNWKFGLFVMAILMYQAAGLKKFCGAGQRVFVR